MIEQFQFVVLEMHEENQWTARLMAEQEVSRRVDMDDCYTVPYRLRVINPATGNILNVHVGERQVDTDSESSSITYGRSPLIVTEEAMGIIGYVMLTDH